MRGSPTTVAFRFALALMAFGVVALVATGLRYAVAASMSPPDDGGGPAALDLWRVTPVRLAIVAIALLEVLAKLGLLFHAMLRRDRPLDGGLVLPSVVGGAGLFGLAASHAGAVLTTTLIAREAGPRVVGEYSIATSLGGSLSAPLWWLGLAGLFVWGAISVYRERAEANASGGAGAGG